MMIFQHYDDADHQDHHLSPPSASFDISGNEAQDVCVSHQNCLVDLCLSEPACLGSGDMISSLKVGWSSGGNRTMKIDVSAACHLFRGEKKCKMNK